MSWAKDREPKGRQIMLGLSRQTSAKVVDKWFLRTKLHQCVGPKLKHFCISVNNYLTYISRYVLFYRSTLS